MPYYGRLACKARQEGSLQWLHQASGLALAQAGQRALLQAGLPQQLLEELQQLPMQTLDDDSEAVRERKHALALHKCQARHTTSIATSSIHFKRAVTELPYVCKLVEITAVCTDYWSSESPPQSSSDDVHTQLQPVGVVNTVRDLCHCSFQSFPLPRTSTSLFQKTRSAENLYFLFQQSPFAAFWQL